MNIAHLLLRAARTYPERPAVSLGATVIATYAQMLHRAMALAAGMRSELDLQPGDCVALIMANCPEYLEILYATWLAGLTAVPINAKLHPEEAAYILEHAAAHTCFVSADLHASIAALQNRIPQLSRVIDVPSRAYEALCESGEIEPHASRPDDVAWLFYTSGTTGRPKGVMITHRNVMAMTLCYFADVDQIAANECVLHAAPMSHGSGMYNFPHVLRGANQVIPAHGHFDPGEIVSLCNHWSGVAFFAAPTMVRRLVLHLEQHPAALPGLKTIIYGGGPMYRTDIQQALKIIGDKFVQIFGQGECPMAITSLTREQISDRSQLRWEDRLASVGTAQSAVEVMVADEHDQPLSAGEIGEVLVRGDIVMKGYWRDPEATAATLRNGWLHTGDVGSIDDDGFLTLRDRSKDMIISGGSNVYPREVEEVLLRHPAVVEVSVVSRPHADWVEEIVAFVVCHAGMHLAESELDDLCLRNIARFKRPRAYRFVDSLPKNNYGKVLKTELRERLRAET
ncbi:MAG: AMP-binding protein [Betaproteobacteria bacterium]